MDIATARTFMEIVRTGSFVNAAAALNLTQTAVSARIRVLEEQLGHQLFVRSKSGASLTLAGERFQRFASDMVFAWDNARRSLASPAGSTTVIALGFEASLWNPLAAHWLHGMRQTHPDFALRVRIGPATTLVEQVAEGTLDAAVVYGAPQQPGLAAELLMEERLVLVRTGPEIAPLDPASHVAIDWGADFDARFRAAFPDFGEPMVAISYGPLALDHLLAHGGSAWFRRGFLRPWLIRGALQLVPDMPEFPYPAHLVHGARLPDGVMVCLREGLRAAAGATLGETL
ncbi:MULTISPECIES: LysR family transcriptional regulator [Novosphingobium]|uniref:LysR family transcriptional regulator n=1 Tax=Novosphingobium TaxID=165696 RepID=UPI001CD5D528|nr:LysR family transcriptional regulator [Novosphingobium percolationis]